MTPTEKVEKLRRLAVAPWICYPRGEEILRELEEILDEPRHDRMPALLVEGPTGNGKSRLGRRFATGHPPKRLPGASGMIYPVILVNQVPEPSIPGFCSSILRAVGAPFPEHQTRARWLAQTRAVLANIDLHMLMIDEFHDLLAGASRQQHVLLNTIKWFGNELQLSIVGIGLPEANRALMVDPQLASRFDSMDLPLWHRGKLLRDLLATVEEILDLPAPSRLYDEPLMSAIEALSEGTLGEILKLLMAAGRKAVSEDHDRITLDLLRSLRWNPPSKRRRGRP